MLVISLILIALAVLIGGFIGMCLFKGCQAIANAIKGRKTP